MKKTFNKAIPVIRFVILYVIFFVICFNILMNMYNQGLKNNFEDNSLPFAILWYSGILHIIFYSLTITKKIIRAPYAIPTCISSLVVSFLCWEFSYGLTATVVFIILYWYVWFLIVFFVKRKLAKQQARVR